MLMQSECLSAKTVQQPGQSFLASMIGTGACYCAYLDSYANQAMWDVFVAGVGN